MVVWNNGDVCHFGSAVAPGFITTYQEMGQMSESELF